MVGERRDPPAADEPRDSVPALVGRFIRAVERYRTVVTRPHTCPDDGATYRIYEFHPHDRTWTRAFCDGLLFRDAPIAEVRAIGDLAAEVVRSGERLALALRAAPKSGSVLRGIRAEVKGVTDPQAETEEAAWQATRLQLERLRTSCAGPVGPAVEEVRACRTLLDYVEERWRGLVGRLRIARTPASECDALLLAARALLRDLPLGATFLRTSFGPPKPLGPDGNPEAEVDEERRWSERRRGVWWSATFGGAPEGPPPPWSPEAEARWRERWATLELREAAAETAGHGTAAGPAPATPDENAMLSPAQLSVAFGLNQDTAEKRLARWRRKHMDGDWIENPDRKPRAPRFFYRVGAVRQTLSQASREVSRERPTNGPESA